MSKQEERREDAGENSTDKILEEIEQDKKNIKKSSALAFAALIAIIALCIAWFVSNTRVTGTSVSVSADDNNPFMLASVGERTIAEKNYLKDENGNVCLIEGNSKEYRYYIDAKTGQKIDTEQTYYTGTSRLAWHMKGQGNFQPGKGGTLEFYVIPKKDNLTSLTVTLNMSGYAKPEKATKAERVENQTVQNLISGHILLFQNLDDTSGYTGWLGANDSEINKLTINAPIDAETNKAVFKKDIPYKVNIYWIWPRYFRNYIYTLRTTQEDLFTDKIEQGNGSEYQKLIQFINENKSVNSDDNGTGKFFYNLNGKTDQTNSFENIQINNQMSDAILDACNQFYNQADEYIGNNVKYIYVEMKVE